MLIGNEEYRIEKGFPIDICVVGISYSYTTVTLLLRALKSRNISPALSLKAFAFRHLIVSIPNHNQLLSYILYLTFHRSLLTNIYNLLRKVTSVLKKSITLPTVMYRVT